MKLVFKVGLLLILAGLCQMELQAEPFQEFTKTIRKNFKINASGTTHIVNKHGDVVVKAGESDRIMIKVTIEVRAMNESTAQKVFDRIGVDFSGNHNYFKAETLIAPQKKNWWDLWEDKSDYSIDYEVFIPRTNNLQLDHTLGNVFVDNLEGTGEITLKHSEFELNGFDQDLELNLSHSNGTLISAQNLNTSMAYSHLMIEEARDIELDSRHSIVSIKKASDIRCASKDNTYTIGVVNEFRNDGDYDKIEIERAQTVVISNAQYSNLIVQEVEKSIDVDISFGGVAIDNVDKGFSYIVLNGTHTDFQLGLAREVQYKMDASADFAGIRYPEKMEVTFEEEKGTNHKVEGYTGGKANSGASVIKARLTYGALKVLQD